MGELYEKIFWLNMFRNGGSYSAGTVAQPKTEWWLNLAGLSVQKGPEYSIKRISIIVFMIIIVYKSIVIHIIVLLQFF